MRVHIELDDETVREVDRLAGRRERSAFIRRAVVAALEEARRSAALRAAAGALEDDGSHEWDADPAAWVRSGRRDNGRRAG